MFSLAEIIELAIQIEKNGETAYRKGQEIASDPAVKKLLGWLAEQEKEHVDWFTELRHSLDKAEVNDDLHAAAMQILKTVLGGQTFSLSEEEIGERQTPDEIMKTALEFEKDTIVFYEMINEFVQEKSTKQGLAIIIEEEQGHVKALTEYFDKTRSGD